MSPNVSVTLKTSYDAMLLHIDPNHQNTVDQKDLLSSFKNFQKTLELMVEKPTG